MGRESLGPQLNAVHKRAAEQAGRANRLTAENRMLESRLARLAAKASPSEVDSSSRDKDAKTPAVQSRLLHKGRAVLVLDGRVALSLESISPRDRKASIRVQVIGGKEGAAVLGPGSSVGIKVGKEVHYLVVKAVHTSSVVFTLVSK